MGRLTPCATIETIETELLLADLAVMEKAVPLLDKVVRSEPRSTRTQELAACAKVLEGLQHGTSASVVGLTMEEQNALTSVSLADGKADALCGQCRGTGGRCTGPMGGSAGRTLWSGPSADRLGTVLKRKWPV